MASKLVNGRKVLVGSKADPGSRAFNRISGGRQVTLKDGTELDAFAAKNYGKQPTVLTNAEIIEKKIPQLNAKANALPSLTQNNTEGTPEAGQDTGGDYEVDDILGLKKKEDTNKKQDAWAKLRTRQNTPEDQEDPYFEQQMGILEDMKKLSDKRTQEDIYRIEQSMKGLYADQMAANASGLASVRNALGRAGALRYSPGSAFSAINSVTAAGTRALAALNAQEQQLISEARSAQATNDYKLLSEKLDLIDEVRKEKAAETSKLSAKIEEQKQQASRDNALAGLIGQGITDPVELLDMLNFDEDGTQVGDFTLKEVTDALSSLKDLRGKGSFAFDEKAIGPLLVAGFTSEDITGMQADLAAGVPLSQIIANVEPEMQQAVKEALGVDEVAAANLTPGVGAKDSVQEQIIRDQVSSTVRTARYGKNASDKEGASIDRQVALMREAGMPAQAIIDSMTGFAPGVVTPYNDTIRDTVLASTEDPNKLMANMNRVSSLLGKGNYKAAVQEAENMAMQRAKTIAGDAYFGDAAAQQYLNNAAELRNALDQAESFVGPIQGSLEWVKGKLGKAKNPKAVDLQAKIVRLTAQMRNDLSGTAVTDSEKKFLEPLIAELQDTEGNFRTKVQNIEDDVLNKLNSTRATVSLPRLSKHQVRYPAQRLNLYATEITSDNATTLDL